MGPTGYSLGTPVLVYWLLIVHGLTFIGVFTKLWVVTHQWVETWLLVCHNVAALDTSAPGYATVASTCRNSELNPQGSTVNTPCLFIWCSPAWFRLGPRSATWKPNTWTAKWLQLLECSMGSEHCLGSHAHSFASEIPGRLMAEAAFQI